MVKPSFMVTGHRKLVVWGASHSPPLGMVAFNLRATPKIHYNPPYPGVEVASEQKACPDVGKGAIEPGLGIGLGPGLWAGFRPSVGPTGVVSLLRRPLVRVLLAMGLEAPLSVEGAGVVAPTIGHIL